MRVIERLKTRAADESGFTMIIAMMVLMVVTLLIGAAFVAANGDVDQSRRDTDAKRAYYAAQAGLSSFLYQLNKNVDIWQTCPSKATTTLPGSVGATYAYAPLPANGQSACSAANPVGTFIQLSSGTFRMKFTGTAGTPAVTRTIVAQFTRQSPLDYLYYSKYETLDPNTYDDPSQYQVCAAFIRQNRPSKCGFIQWVTGDTINGPLYTQDQYYICGSPTFARAGTNDVMASAAPVDPNDSVGHGAVIKGCAGNPTYNGAAGNPQAGAATIDPPSDNTNLLPYAQTYGKTYTGKTVISIAGSTATITNASVAGGAPQNVSLTSFPIIYVANGSGCSSTYTPYFNGTSNYTNATTCGNVQIKTTSDYTASFTIAAANDIIITGDLTTSLSGSAVAGLVANNFIRVEHGVNRTQTSPSNCGTDSNISGYTLNDVEIDAAILALQHSFIVDNYDCGSPITGHLNVTGAIAQIFRGTVGTGGGGGGSVNSGYLKNYNYDDRLAILQPPYLFDLASSSWKVVRETGCTAGSTDPNIAC